MPSFRTRGISLPQKSSLLLYALIGLLSSLVVLQCLLLAGSIFTLDAARAYASGEGAWSKAQKNATRHLLHYAHTGDPNAFAAYENEIAVPLADRRAREQLLAAAPNFESARRALLEGRNHPRDVRAMTWFLRLFRSMPEVAAAIDAWARADAGIADLEAAARSVRAAWQHGTPSHGDIEAHAAAIARIDARLASVSEDFAYATGAAARRLRSIAIASAIGVAGLLLLIGMSLAWRILQRAHRVELELRKFVEHSSDLFTLLDSEGRYLFASPNIERQLGWTDADRAARSALEFVHPDDLPRVREELAAVLAHPETPRHLELRFLHKNGSYRLFELSGSGIRTRDGIEIAIISRDVTEKRVLERDLARAQKLESIGRLAGGIAHDFNNLLTAVLGHAEEARAQATNAARVEEALDEIVRASERAAHLTQQLLTFARRQKVAPRPLDLGALVRGMRGMLVRALGDPITLSLDLEPDLGWVCADPGQIEQVILNLVLNARDAMPDGGHVAIEARNVEPQDGATDTARVSLAVSDTGCGIDPETASQLFEPFFSTKPDGRGTGLGLATCYGIVEQAGGEIRVDGAPGRGARFEVLLPRVAAESPRSASQHSPADAPGGHETVLVVEDEPTVRRVTVRNLESKGYRVFEAQDGIDALAFLESHGDTVALVVSDVQMPRLGGAALAARIAERWPETRVLLVSGYAHEAAIAQQASRGAFLQKPFTREELAAAVRAALDA